MFGDQACSFSLTDQAQLSEHLPKGLDYNTLTIANKPGRGEGTETKLLKEIVQFKVARLGLK